MRIGVLPDVHGNLLALDAVLADLERERVGQIVVLGDVAVGPQPTETIERLLSLDFQILRRRQESIVMNPGSVGLLFRHPAA